MADFEKYPSVRRYGSQYGFTNGLIHLFSKIDGCATQTSADLMGNIMVGSRNDILDYDSKDIALGKYIDEHPNLKQFIINNPDLIIYGEFMRPQEIRYYDKSCWGNFYVYDIKDTKTNRFMQYEDYKILLDKVGIEYIPLITTLDCPTIEQIAELFESANFLLTDKGGPCEGIVLKNYDYVRRDGEQHWERVVTSEFRKAKGVKPQDHSSVDVRIVNEYCTDAQISKSYYKALDKVGVFNDSVIIQTYNRVYHDIVVEDMWEILVKYKDPVVNFVQLKKLIEKKVREWIGVKRQSI